MKLNRQQKIKKSTYQLFLWTGSWVISTAVLAFGPKLLWEFEIAFTSAAIALNIATGLLMLRAFYQHLMGLDELQRQTHLEALAVAFGITLVSTVTYTLLLTAGIVDQATPSNILFISSISYIGILCTLWIRRTS